MRAHSIPTSITPQPGRRSAGLVATLLAPIDVRIDGSRPWDIQIHNPRTIHRFLSEGRRGFGESYMDGWWDCEALDELSYRIMRAHADGSLDRSRLLLHALRARLFNLQRKGRAFQIAEAHYDLGNDLFEAMLDSRLVYSCGYWDGAATLEEAQERKLDLICRKIGLRSGMRVLDIGCGWGSFAKYAAEHYGARVVGITVSREQMVYAQEHCNGLPVEIRLQDYRDVEGRFDRVVSVGMFEHVGYKNYRSFMRCVKRVLDPRGLLLLHAIGSEVRTRSCDPWIARYIFPNSMIPCIAQIGDAIEDLFVMEDWHNFGAYYDKTLMAWWRNFQTKWQTLQDRYGERFYRMWRYYLLTCAGAFRARSLSLWQIVLSPNGVPGGYSRPV